MSTGAGSSCVPLCTNVCRVGSRPSASRHLGVHGVPGPFTALGSRTPTALRRLGLPTSGPTFRVGPSRVGGRGSRFQGTSPKRTPATGQVQLTKGTPESPPAVVVEGNCTSSPRPIREYTRHGDRGSGEGRPRSGEGRDTGLDPGKPRDPRPVPQDSRRDAPTGTPDPQGPLTRVSFDTRLTSFTQPYRGVHRKGRWKLKISSLRPCPGSGGSP